MRITKLEFENLNSLKGKWSVDFTHPDYAQNHDIFVIHGPTGSGKTTLLDAITLALYGKTPRLQSINSGEGGNEIMTRGTGFCRAAVTYSCRNGVFVSEFQQNRANGKANGNLQRASYKITRLDSKKSDLGELFDSECEVVASGTASHLEDETKKIIQLDYKQFCRSIMLAQGEFSAFLESDSRERAEILEKLTGTERYREIGKKIAGKFSEIKKNFQFVKSQKEEIENLILSDEDEKKAKNSESQMVEQLSSVEKNLLALEKEFSVFEEIERLKSDGEKLAFSIKNSDLAFSDAEKKAVQAKEQLDFEEKKLLEEQALWKKVRELDVKIVSGRQKSSESGARKTSAEKMLSETEAKISYLQKNLENLEKSLLEIENYIASNKNDGNLSESIAKIDTLKNAFEQSKKNAVSLKGNQNLLEKKLSSLVSMSDSLKAQLEELDEEIKSFVSADAVFIAKIMRTQLADGKPCPVCGSPYHASHGNSLAEESPERSEILDAKKISGLAEKSTNLTAKRDETDAKINETASQIEAVKSDIRNNEANITQAENLMAENLAKINEILSVWEKSVSAENLGSVLNELASRAENWKAKNEAAKKMYQEKSACDAEKNTLAENLSVQKENLEKAAAEFENERVNLQALFDERNAIFGAKNVDFEENQKNNKIVALKQSFEAAQNLQNQMKEQKARLEAQKGQIEKLLAEKEAELAKIQHESGAENIRGKNEIISEKNNVLANKKELNDSLIAVKTMLQANEQNKSRAEKILAEYENLREEYGIWEQMNKWAGMREGADLSVFVQSLAFNSLLSLANKNLFGITNRYKVVQKSPMSLEFEINDIYITDGNRSVANLSGGEKFLVSLSFALAISEFASRNVRVDSLFLDEGFGTLSGELLTEAINALKNLQKDGKMLGIITHVQDVIGEIDQRIEVKPVSGGHSVLIGSGIN